jgi:hypothetical protein
MVVPAWRGFFDDAPEVDAGGLIEDEGDLLP